MLDPSSELTAIPSAVPRGPEALSKKLLTEHEIAQFLRVSREAILRFKRDRADPIPCYKVGRRYLYEPSEVLRWAKRHADRAQRKYRQPI